ncbi:unnamed protein product [Camellia sinensis]
MLSCKMLTLITHIKKWDICGIERLLQSSPYLETLVVDMSTLYYPTFQFCSNFLNSYGLDGEQYWVSHEGVFKCWMMKVKTIKIVGFREVGEGFALPLLQFLLKNAKVLEKMIIKTGNSGFNQCLTCSVSQEFVRFTQKLLSFPRASPLAAVVFS